MGFKKCPECGHNISEKARYCPECGCEIDYNTDKEVFNRKKSDTTDKYQNDMKESIKYKTDEFYDYVKDKKREIDIKKEHINLDKVLIKKIIIMLFILLFSSILIITLFGSKSVNFAKINTNTPNEKIESKFAKASTSEEEVSISDRAKMFLEIYNNDIDNIMESFSYFIDGSLVDKIYYNTKISSGLKNLKVDKLLYRAIDASTGKSSGLMFKLLEDDITNKDAVRERIVNSLDKKYESYEDMFIKSIYFNKNINFVKGWKSNLDCIILIDYFDEINVLVVQREQYENSLENLISLMQN